MLLAILPPQQQRPNPKFQIRPVVIIGQKLDCFSRELNSGVR